MPREVFVLHHGEDVNVWLFKQSDCAGGKNGPAVGGWEVVMGGKAVVRGGGDRRLLVVKGVEWIELNRKR